MERLKNKTILIGKEPVNGRLLISMKVNGQIKKAIVGNDSISNSVSRCKPEEDIAHCKIDVDSQCKMRLINMKDANVTYVNDISINSKPIDLNSKVTLGKDKFSLNISSVLNVAQKMVGEVVREPKSIAHLENVWNEYEKSLEDIQRRQQNRSKRSSLPIMISMSLGVVSIIISKVFHLQEDSAIFIIISILPLLMYLKNYKEQDTSIEDRKRAKDVFIDEYVCPHCNHYLGEQQYKVLKQNKNCPYCKGGWMS